MDKKKQHKTTYNSEVTKEDIDALGKKNLSMDAKDDRPLQDRKKPVDFTGKDLDVPGRDDVSVSKNKKIKLKDEENSLYGQGGERKENLEAPERANSSKS